VTGAIGDQVRPSIEDTWRAMESLVREGLVRSIGTSNFSAKKLESIMQYAEVLPSVCQAEAHPYHRNGELVEWCSRNGIHFTAFSPLGSPDSESIFPRKIPAVLLQDPTVRAVARRTGRNVGQVLIRWALQRGTSVIPKSTNPDRIRGNLDVLEWELGAEDFFALSSIRFQQRMVNGALWLNDRGPYRTMEDLWDEPELIPRDEDYPGREEKEEVTENIVSSPPPPPPPEPEQRREYSSVSADTDIPNANSRSTPEEAAQKSPQKGRWRTWLSNKQRRSPKKNSTKG